MNRPLSIRPEAEAEIAEAHDWYEERKPGVGAPSWTKVRKAPSAIEAAPERCSIVRTDVRRRILDRFLYSILYLAEPAEIVVLACFHGKRDPRRSDALRSYRKDVVAKHR